MRLRGIIFGIDVTTWWLNMNLGVIRKGSLVARFPFESVCLRKIF